MTQGELIDYWLKAAEDSWETALGLVKLKKYHHALFFCHLALEKILKCLVFKKTDSHALPIHDLVKLAEQAGIFLTEGQRKDLEEITTWNIQARYDTVKRAFYKKSTEKFTDLWTKKVGELFLWFKNQY